MDNIGFAVVIPGPFMDGPLVATLLKSPPEDVLSQIRIDFSMILNLLLSHKPEEIKEILFRSFANYLNLKNRDERIEERIKEAGKRLMEFLPHSLCNSPESVLTLSRKRATLGNGIRRIKEDQKELETDLTVAYARVSSRDQKEDLKRQVERLELYCAAKGWCYEVIQDLGSGINYRKKGLKQLLEKILNCQVKRVVLTHKDRLLRIGGELVFALCEARNVGGGDNQPGGRTLV